MDAYKETFSTWDKVAHLYEDKFMELDIYNSSYVTFCNQLGNENASVLEIGCGPGNITKYLLQKMTGLQVEGIDISPNMIALAEKNNPSAKFRVMDCRDIAQIHNTFNGIVCGFCLPYLSPADAATFIRDCSELLTADGIFYLSFVEGDASQSGFKTGSTGDRTYFYYYDLEEVKNLLGANNLKLIESMLVPFSRKDNEPELHTIIIAKKYK